MPRIARLWTDLELESSQFSVGLRKAVAESTAASARIQKTLGGIKASLLGAGAALASVGFMARAQEALDYASSLGEVAQQLGVTTADLQEYRYAATQAGISQEAMDKSLAKLTKTMGEARAGGKAQAETFRELNSLIGKDILASAESAGGAIPLIADALAKVEDPTKRARLETELFGKAGQQLDPLLSGGSRAVNELRDAAHSLGIVLSDRQIQDADKTADKLSELNTVLSANIASQVADNTASIYGFVDSIGAMIARIPDGIRALRNFWDEMAVVEAAGNSLLVPALTDQSAEKVREARARISSRNGAAAQSAVDSKLERAGLTFNRRKRPPAKSGDATPTPAASSARSRSRGGSGESAADKAERTRLWYEDQITRMKLDELSLQDQIIGSYRTRYAVAIARIEANKADFARDMAEQKGLTAAQRAELTAANDLVVQRETELADREKFVGMQREAFDLFAAENDALQESARAQVDMARTAGERRAAELRLLDLQKEAERAQIELVLATESTASAAWQNAQRRKDGLDGVYADRAAAVKRDTMGPMARYLDSLPRTAGEIGEAYEEIAVRGIDRMNASLGTAIQKTLGLKGAVGELISEMLLLEAKRTLFGAGGGGLFSTIASFFGTKVDTNVSSISAATSASLSAMTLPKLARGGVIEGFAGIDRNVLSINGRPTAMVSAGERISVTPDKMRPANDTGLQVVQHISLAGGVDLASRTEVYRIAAATKQATLAAMNDMSRRRG